MEESKKRVDHNEFQRLGHEIISEILARLPIEWILICKSVCKTWYALIKDNYFVRLQLSIANNRPSSLVIFKAFYGMNRDEFSKIYLLDIEDCKTREIPGFPLADHNNDIEYYLGMTVNCSLDGLICLASKLSLDPVVIYNPLIRGDYIILPKTKARNVSISSHHVTLGFDHSIKKYKAVRMLTYNDRSFLCEVITIGEDSSWRHVVPPFAGSTHHVLHEGVFNQGSIYWIIEKLEIRIDCRRETSSSDKSEYVLEFDVTKEVFGIITFPPLVRTLKGGFPGPDDLFLIYKLQVLGGCVALVEYESGLLHIWRLVKQNGSHVIGYSSIRVELPYKDSSVKAFFFPNGTENLLLLKIKGGTRKGERRKRKEPQFFCYYPFSSSSKKSDRYVKLSSLHNISPGGFSPRYFKPSLISAKVDFPKNL